MVKQVNLSNLRRKTVYDVSGDKVGRINDLIINKKSLDVRGFVIHGSFAEELLENLNLRKDFDPLITAGNIVSMDENSIKLNVNKSDLSNAMEPGEIKDNEMLFSDIKIIPVNCKNDNEIGIFKDVYFAKDGTPSYCLGGKNFFDILRAQHCSPDMDYIVDQAYITQTEKGYKVDTELSKIEKGMKLTLTNLVRDFMIIAERDGEISDDEKDLINSVKVDLEVYFDALEKANEDNIITIEERAELEKIKEEIMENVVNVARQDEVVTKEERELVKRLASYMADKSSELFWKSFGTTYF